MANINFAFGVIGTIGSVISIVGAIKSTKESNNAKKYLKEINIKKTAIEAWNLKENINNLHGEVNKLMFSKITSRSFNKEKQTYEKWVHSLNNILLQPSKGYEEIIIGLDEVRDILNSHTYRSESLHDTKIGKESSFQYIEGVLYRTTQLINKKVELD